MATLAGRPTSSYRLRAPVAGVPSRWRREEQWLERPALVQFVYLSLLLHAMAILLFGAPTGGSSEGRAMWGSLNVTLLGPTRQAPEPGPLVEPRIAAPPAAKLERALPPPAAKKPAPRAAPMAPPRPAASPRDAAPIDVPLIVPPVIERIAAPPLKIEKALPVPRMEVIAVPDAPPIAVPAPIQPIAPDLPRVERTFVEPPKIAVPLAQPVAPPARAAPPVERAPVETPLMPTLPMQRLETAPIEAPVIPAPPKPQAQTQAPIETQAVPAAPPTALERAPADVAPPPAAKPAPAPQAPPKAERAPAPELAPRALPSRPAASAPAPLPRRGDDSGTYDPTRPALDLDAVRNRASQMAREGVGQRALLPFPMPAPPERKSKTEEALEKARKPDCRTAYQSLGLAAVLPLLANEIGEGTCRW